METWTEDIGEGATSGRPVRVYIALSRMVATEKERTTGSQTLFRRQSQGGFRWTGYGIRTEVDVLRKGSRDSSPCSRMGRAWNRGDHEVCSQHDLMQVMTMIRTWQPLEMPNGDQCNKNENGMSWEEAEQM